MRTRPGWSGSLPATGWSSSSPKRRAKATCSARVMSWSRKNTTRCFSKAVLIWANRSASRLASPRFTPLISAPMAGVNWRTCMVGSPGGQGSNHKNGRPGGLAGFQVAVGLNGVGQGVALVDLDADAAGGDVAKHLGRQFGFFNRVGDVVGQGGAGQVQRALAGQDVRVERGYGAAGRAHTHHQAAALERVE